MEIKYGITTGKKKHREDGPAWEDIHGNKEWYVNGYIHRDNDLPAVVMADGKKEWYQNGYRHHDNDLPAIIASEGLHAWYQNGNQYRITHSPINRNNLEYFMELVICCLILQLMLQFDGKLDS